MNVTVSTHVAQSVAHASQDVQSVQLLDVRQSSHAVQSVRSTLATDAVAAPTVTTVSFLAVRGPVVATTRLPPATVSGESVGRASAHVGTYCVDVVSQESSKRRDSITTRS